LRVNLRIKTVFEKRARGFKRRGVAGKFCQGFIKLQMYLLVSSFEKLLSIPAAQFP
jgi:hypothetical protein